MPDPDQISLTLTPQELEIIQDALGCFHEHYYGVSGYEEDLVVAKEIGEKIDAVTE